MNRLTGVRLGTVQIGTSAYDGYGRMTAKTADGQAVFSNAVYSTTAKPHAMDAAETLSGVFPSQQQNISYKCFDKVSQIMQGNKSLNYTYGYDHQRIFMEEHIGANVRTKRYVGNCEYVTETSGNTTTQKWLTCLTGPTGVYAVVVTENNANTIHYILKDNLGSWATITNGNGAVEQSLSYDAWGNLRNPNTWTGDFTGTPMFDRGYTGHEHLYAFGLINMNGRMYDPVMSSFLSADRFVQNPMSAQGFNRYAYCMYNPLRFVDPSGWAPRPGGGHGPDDPPPYVVIEGWASGYKLDEVIITPFYEFEYTPYYNTGGGGDLQWGLGDNIQPNSHTSGGGGGNHGGNSNNMTTNPNVNIDIFSKLLITANLYTSIESKSYYNPFTKTWKDKLDIIREFDYHGNQYTGGKNSFGKMMSKRYTNAGRVLGLVGVGLSYYQFDQAITTEDKLEFGFDTFIGFAGVVAPELFGLPATIWFLGGKQVTFWYSRTTIIPMIENGINPGLMEYQPFK